MKIVLRNEVSSMSILLFIYNILYMRSKRNHFYLSSLIEIMKQFDKTESATRMALSRACKAGILTTHKENKDVVYTLLPKALEHIQDWNLNAQYCAKRVALRNMDWDNQWHFITVSIDDQTLRSRFSERQKQLGYIQINAQTWLSPYHQINTIKSFLQDLDTHLEWLSVCGTLESNMEMHTYIKDKFKLSHLRSAYDAFIVEYQSLLQQLKQEPSSLANGKALQILHKLGYAYFTIASEDPMLPRPYIPQWSGDQAAKLMFELRMIIEAEVWNYLKDFA